FTDQYTFSPTYTNEFRFSYGRQDAEVPRISPGSVPEARTLPRIDFSPLGLINSPGIDSQALQGQQANNLLFQETQTKLNGRHTFRYGVDFLRQLASQRPAAQRTGNVIFAPAAGYSAFANFLDDFSGLRGHWRRDFGVTEFHPDQFHQTYF